VLGCTVEKRQPAISLTQLRAGRTLIDIVPAGEAGPAAGEQTGRGANLDHFCLRIEPFDAAAIQAHFKAAGHDCGEENSRFGADGQGPSVYLTDPEGNGVELKGPPAA
jgi:glyoxylase I family protein